MKIYNSHEYVNYVAGHMPYTMRYDGRELFVEWQKKARTKLEELLGLPSEKCNDLFAITKRQVCDGYERVDFEFQSEEGFFVPCNLLIPMDGDKRHPGMICLQGHSSGKHISMGVAKFEGDYALIDGGRDFAIRAVKEGCCAIIMDQRYMGAAGQNEKGTPSCNSDHEGLAALLIGRTAIGERVWDIIRLIDVIFTHLQEYIDVDKLVCMGNSGGGTTTFYASCMDERIRFSMPSCSVCTYEASIMAMNHCSCNFIPGIRKYFNMGDLGGLIAPRPLVVVCGEEDPIFPLEGVKETFNTIKKAYKQFEKEDLCRLIVGKGGHQFYPDDAWPVMHELFGVK